MDPIRVREVQRRLEEGQGGYEIVHQSEGLELGVYVLVAPEPDRQQPHDRDEVYVVLSGRGSSRSPTIPCRSRRETQLSSLQESNIALPATRA